VAANILYGPEASNLYKYYLFIRRGKQYTSEMISNLFQAESLRVMGVSIGVNQYRQVAIAFMTTKLKHQIKLSIEEVVEEDETLFDAQAGHSAEVAAMHYAKSQFSFKHVDSVMLQHFFKCSVEWQTLLGELLFLSFTRLASKVIMASLAIEI
jgi:hypothetical protein